ncbi:hypothetical protein DSM112329_02927 [Paraconexibacter sp. AEG42_29]|uniref:Lipoprotein LpqB beta-propeller domain-containing protein n=1 Tax=Paraconexibacter sp. AEG42_29 TaxID=2997339 RepID=A0AAU7AWJ4_9ACTN
MVEVLRSERMRFVIVATLVAGLAGCGARADTPTSAASARTTQERRPAAPPATAVPLPPEVRNAELLVSAARADPDNPDVTYSRVELVGADGRRRTVFRGGWGARWSPDGRLVARYERGGHANSYGGYSTKLVSSRLDGSGRKLFKLPRRRGSPLSVEGFSWFPDSLRLAVNAVVSDGEEPPRTVLVGDRDGSDRSTLRLPCREASSVSVSPDGKRIAYGCGAAALIASARDDTPPSVVRDASRSELTLSRAATLAWRPDGRQIAVDLEDQGQRARIILARTGSGSRVSSPPVTVRQAEDLSWSPSGRYVAYVPSEDADAVLIAQTADGKVIRRLPLAGAGSVSWRP